MAKVFVVMGNDFPQAVLDDRAAADARVEKLRAEDRAQAKKDGWTLSFDGTYYRVFYRHYKFELESEG